MLKTCRSACIFALTLLASCGGGGDSAGESAVSDVNKAVYDRIAEADYVNSAQSQPAVPGSGELFAEGTKHFAMALAQPGLARQKAGTMYVPVNSSRTKDETVPGVTNALPDFKPVDATPASCNQSSGAEREQCLADADSADINFAPAFRHSSYHDADSLDSMGIGHIAERAADKVVASLRSHIGAAQGAEVAAALSGYIGGPALSEGAIFDRQGYRLSHAVVTDNSRADTDADGDLEQHSTVIVELTKPAGSSPLSNALAQCAGNYGSASPREEFLVSITAFIHLDSLSAQRITEAAEVPEGSSWQAVQEASWNRDASNHAFDANVLRLLFSDGSILPWSSTEYAISFQPSPDTISSVYNNLIGASQAAGDQRCADLFEERVDAHTALITGHSGQPDVFYHTAVPETQKVAAGIPEQYAKRCLVDSSGELVLLDAGGKTYFACDQRKLVSSASVKWTKPGACLNDHSHWAYLASRARTRRFGRGIQWILTELFLHNQAGDYQNIHWWNNPKKAAVQTAVKAAGFVAKTAIEIQLGTIGVPDAPLGTTTVYVVNTILPFFASVLNNLGSLRIAGYAVLGVSDISAFFLNLAVADGSDATFSSRFADAAKNAFYNYLIDRTADGLCQTVDVTAVGWQDYSDGSHYGCFEFSY